MNLFTASVFDLKIDRVGAATFGHRNIFTRRHVPPLLSKYTHPWPSLMIS